MPKPGLNVFGLQVGRRKKATHRTILRKLSGSVHSGHLLAVMGPTGTTLVVLAVYHYLMDDRLVYCLQN